MNMSMNLKKGLLPKLRARYERRGRAGKTRMLIELCEDHGYERKHAIKLLGDTVPRPSGRAHPGPAPRYALIEPVVRTFWLAASLRTPSRSTQRAEVANPGRARCQTGEAEEEPGLRGQGERVAPVAGKPDEPGKHEDDDPGANQRGQIRVDILNSDLGEDGGEGGDYSMCCIMNDPLPGFGRTVRKNRNKCPGKRSA